MRFSLRTLLIVMLIAGPLCAFGWQKWESYQAQREIDQLTKKIRPGLMSIGGIQPKIPVASAAEREIWDQQRDKISWESFPESTPPTP